MRKVKLPDRSRNRRIVWSVIIEIIVMSVGVICCILPLPWRLVVPIIIGAREIILKAYRITREPGRTGAPARKKKK